MTTQRKPSESRAGSIDLSASITICRRSQMWGIYRQSYQQPSQVASSERLAHSRPVACWCRACGAYLLIYWHLWRRFDNISTFTNNLSSIAQFDGISTDSLFVVICIIPRDIHHSCPSLTISSSAFSSSHLYREPHHEQEPSTPRDNWTQMLAANAPFRERTSLVTNSC
jgi:hypothetical protein